MNVYKCAGTKAMYSGIYNVSWAFQSNPWFQKSPSQKDACTFVVKAALPAKPEPRPSPAPAPEPELEPEPKPSQEFKSIVVSTVVAITGAVSPSSFLVELKKRLPATAVVNITSFQMVAKSTATLTCPSSDTFTPMQLNQFMAGVKAATGADSVEVGEVSGCVRRRYLDITTTSRRQLVQTAAISYTVKTSNPAKASKMAKAMTDTAEFSKTLVAKINDAAPTGAGGLAALSITDVKSHAPLVTTEIKYQIVVPQGTDTSVISSVTDDKRGMAEIANTSRVPGTSTISADDIAVQTKSSLSLSPPPPPLTAAGQQKDSLFTTVMNNETVVLAGGAAACVLFMCCIIAICGRYCRRYKASQAERRHRRRYEASQAKIVRDTVLSMETLVPRPRLPPRTTKVAQPLPVGSQALMVSPPVSGVVDASAPTAAAVGVMQGENVGPPQVTQQNGNVTEMADTDPPVAMASAPPADQVVPTLPVSEGEEVEAAEVQEGADAVSSV